MGSSSDESINDLIFSSSTEVEEENKLDDMEPEEQERYELFRRTGLPKGEMRRLIFDVLNQSVNPNFLISICAIGKVFVGEVIKEALKNKKENGPLLPSDIHEAYRRLYNRMANMKKVGRKYFK